MDFVLIWRSANSSKKKTLCVVMTFGIVDYYARFSSNLSTRLHPLYELLVRIKPWKWSEKCVNALNNVKHTIASDDVLTHYDPTLYICIATDASPVGRGAVLSHIMPDGTERQVGFASRSCSSVRNREIQQICL